MSVFSTALNLIPGVSEAKLIVGAAVGALALGAISFGVYQIENYGYNRAAVKYQKQITDIKAIYDKERLRQEAVQDQVQNQVKFSVQSLVTRNEELEKEMKGAQEAAAKATTAANACITSDGVRRINGVGDGQRKTTVIKPKL